MGNLQSVLFTVFGLVVTFFVPAIVWITLMAGLYQLVRDGIRRLRVAPRRSRGFIRKGYGQRAG